MLPPDTVIIIKKIKKSSHGHHGGAWKVAYADFVTAMMSFFLLLWLLAATPVEKLKGLADYFSPTLGVKGRLGIGFFGGQAPDSEGFSRSNWASVGLVFGAPPSGPIIKLTDRDNKTDEDSQKIELNKVAEDVKKDLASDGKLSEYQDSLLIEQTPDGLKINVTDTDSHPMFKAGSAELQDYAKEILTKIAGIIKFLPNYLQVVGHTSTVNNSNDENYTNWELSAARANAARRYLIQQNVESIQFARIQAVSDQEPLDHEHPESAKNNRITVTLLRKTKVAHNRQAAPEEIIMEPIEAGLKTYSKTKSKLESNEKKQIVTPEDIAAAKATNSVKHFNDADLAKEHKKNSQPKE